MIHSKLICLVDDNADYRLLVQLFFQRSCPEHAIHSFMDGKDFLKALPQMSQLPSLIILDRHMPKFDGHQTLEYLKQHPVYKRIPVVMMSADASIKEIDGCYESGANSFLKKSIDPAFIQDSLSVICYYWLSLNQTPNLA